MERHIGRGEQHVTVTDVTAAWSVLSLQGPQTRSLLQDLVDADLSAAAFPFATAREVDIGFARALVCRLSYVGELGFELYIPVECAAGVCERILAAGEPHGLRPAGYHTIEHLRSEGGYREYQLDLTPLDTPLEAGLGFTLKLDRDVDFVGREALLRQRAAPLTKRLVLFRLQHPEVMLHHDEPIWLDGRIAGYVSSGAYGHTLGCSVGMGYVHHADGVTSELVGKASFEIEVAGERWPAEGSFRPFYDPTGSRRRA
jgi:4-methylaminobutanoate oxidase (formaldehyde-forming)